MRKPLHRRWWWMVVAVLVAGGGRSATGAEPRPTRRDPEGAGQTERRDPDPKSGDLVGRRERRDPEGGGGGADEQTDQDKLALVWREGGCSIDGHRAFVKALLATENTSDVMSLEVWGDSHEYAPYQKVFYYLRVPRAAYVTLFWIGPHLDIFVPFQNLRIPGSRDVSVDPDSIVVPPLGREQWVAIASLEAVPLPCFASEDEQLSWLQQVRALTHGVGRWEVRSKDAR